jgi:hypothetical protein
LRISPKTVEAHRAHMMNGRNVFSSYRLRRLT